MGERQRRAFGRWERFSSSRRGVVLVFLWAVAEATVWPIIPDFLLIPMETANRRRSPGPLLASVAGMAFDGDCLFLRERLSWRDRPLDPQRYCSLG